MASAPGRRMASPTAMRSSPRTAGGALAARPGGAKGAAAVDPSQLMDRVKELEKSSVQEAKERKKEEEQRRKDMMAAKKRITKEIQSATKQVKKSEMDITKLNRALQQCQQQNNQAHSKKSKQIEAYEALVAKINSKHHDTERLLQERMAVVGEARGRLAHAELAQKMLQLGVAVPTEGGGVAVANGWPDSSVNISRIPPLEDGQEDDEDEETDALPPEVNGVAATSLACQPLCAIEESALVTSQTSQKDTSVLESENGRLCEENERLRAHLEEAQRRAEKLAVEMAKAKGGFQSPWQPELPAAPVSPKSVSIDASPVEINGFAIKDVNAAMAPRKHHKAIGSDDAEELQGVRMVRPSETGAFENGHSGGVAEIPDIMLAPPSKQQSALLRRPIVQAPRQLPPESQGSASPSESAWESCSRGTFSGSFLNGSSLATSTAPRSALLTIRPGEKVGQSALQTTASTSSGYPSPYPLSPRGAVENGYSSQVVSEPVAGNAAGGGPAPCSLASPRLNGVHPGRPLSVGRQHPFRAAAGGYGNGSFVAAGPGGEQVILPGSFVAGPHAPGQPHPNVHAGGSASSSRGLSPLRLVPAPSPGAPLLYPGQTSPRAPYQAYSQGGQGGHGAAVQTLVWLPEAGLRSPPSAGSRQVGQGGGQASQMPMLQQQIPLSPGTAAATIGTMRPGSAGRDPRNLRGAPREEGMSPQAPLRAATVRSTPPATGAAATPVGHGPAAAAARCAAVASNPGTVERASPRLAFQQAVRKVTAQALREYQERHATAGGEDSGMVQPVSVS
eukprot:TRINITY_DN18009_c0_g1_i1.p1 TRINITY_DN18009_c0_g1~~TRINITY_DN18009_c0_g1_i1.p1  ORF type:complete len:790 (-),score=183.13 TRINITY_DN18009_c0_g1_i1:74-2443(-)